MEASANSQLVNTMNTMDTMSPASGEPNRSEEIQVLRSPQRLSLQINGLNAGSRDKYNSNTTYIESSERGSDTSCDSQRPELQPASTSTDYLPSIPSSSLNDSDQSMDGSIGASDGNSQTFTTDHKLPHFQDTLKSLQVSGNGGPSGSHADVNLEKESEDSLGPLRSSSRPGVGKFTPGHKRTATGDVKPISFDLATSQNSDANGTTRQRSKSTGSSAHGSRIAQVTFSFHFWPHALLTRM